MIEKKKRKKKKSGQASFAPYLEFQEELNA